jgi:multidrug efflux pump subunit AcrA (membrane-fusion protein)
VFLLGSYFFESTQIAFPGVVARPSMTLSTPGGGVVSGLTSRLHEPVSRNQVIAYMTNSFHYRSTTQLQSALLDLEKRIQGDTDSGHPNEIAELANYLHLLLGESLHEPSKIQETKTAIEAKLRGIQELVQPMEEDKESPLVQELRERALAVERLIFRSSEPRMVVSHFDGVLIDILVANGDTVLPGATLAEIQLDPASVTAYLPPEDLEHVASGQTVDIRHLSETVTGRISSIGKTVTTLPDTLNSGLNGRSSLIQINVKPDAPIDWPTGVPIEIKLH